MRPNALITRKYLARGLLLWIGARILVSVLVAFAGMSPLHLTFSATVLMVGGSVVLGFAELIRRHERALLENLAISRTTLFGLLAAPAIIGELFIAAAAALRG